MKNIFVSVAALLLTVALHAQSVSINTTGLPANSSAMLDITSTSKGLLIPRMDSTSRLAIASPAKGLLVLDTSYNVLYQYDGMIWAYVAFNKTQVLFIAAGTAIWDCRQGLNTSITLTGNITLSVQNALPGMIGILRIRQDGTGNRQLILPAGSRVSKGGAGILTLSTAPATEDIASFYYDGQNWYWHVMNNFN